MRGRTIVALQEEPSVGRVLDEHEDLDFVNKAEKKKLLRRYYESSSPMHSLVHIEWMTSKVVLTKIPA